MITPQLQQEMRQKAIALIEQLSTENLLAIVQLLELLVKPFTQTPPSPEEAVLLDIIQRHLPADQQTRLVELRDRCEWGELTSSEHQELIDYEDWLEQQNVERLEALMQLAKLHPPAE